MKMKYLILISTLIFAHLSLALPGSPKVVNCEMVAQISSLSPAYLQELIKKACGNNPQGSCDIGNVILPYSKRVTLQQRTQYKCDFYNGQLSTCLARGTVKNAVLFSYGFNSQSGSIHLVDNVTGNEVSANWLNQHDVTKSGYLHSRLALKNYKGGILGDPKIWEIEANCWAAQNQW